MKSRIIRSALLALSVGAGLAAVSTDLAGYNPLGYKWNTSQVVYYINAQNSSSVPQANASAAIQAGASSWSEQSRANVQLVYGGTTNGSTLALNFKNEVFFRNESGAGGLTYWYTDGSGNLIDADIVLRELDYDFVSDAETCAGYQINIRDIVTHEFGHVLGLNHSSAGDATMYAYMPGYCDTSWRTLSADDIAGIEALYPPAASVQAPSNLTTAPGTTPSSMLNLSWSDNASNESGFRIERSTDGVTFAQVAQVGSNVRNYTNSGLAAGTVYAYRVYTYNSSSTSGYSNVATGQTATATNTAPSVSITNPANGASYPSSSAVTFSGNASDTQDGSLTSSMRWTSSIDGQIGTGSGFARTLSPGSHAITAAATDAQGLTGSRQVSMVVTVTGGASASGPSLTASGVKVKGVPNVTLTWSGFASANVDVFRNGVKVVTTPNDGTHKDVVKKGAGSYNYQTCEAGTGNCSNVATVTF